MNVLIEPALPDDLPDIASIEEIIEGANAASPAVLEARFSMFSEGFFVARHKGQIVGYAQSCLWDEQKPAYSAELNFFGDRHNENGETLYLIFVGVLPKFHRRGIASELLQSLTKLAHQKECKKVHAVTFDHLLPLYTKQGFSPINKMPGFLPIGDFTLLEYFLNVEGERTVKN